MSCKYLITITVTNCYCTATRGDLFSSGRLLVTAVEAKDEEEVDDEEEGVVERTAEEDWHL